DTLFASGFGNNDTSGPFGLEFDPINNDLFVSTWEGDASIFNSIIQIQGFSHVTTTTITTTTQPPTTTTVGSTTTTTLAATTTTSTSPPPPTTPPPTTTPPTK